jgi:hypothetical protein
MLPNFKIVICAILFAVLLFAMTGAGTVTPETYTRIGESPEIGRPMMQRMITDVPAQAQLQALTFTRRAEELERLHARTALEVEAAEASLGPGMVQQAVIEGPEPDAVVPTVAAAPALERSGAMGTVPATPPANTPEAVEAQTLAATANPDGDPTPATIPGGAPDTMPAANAEPEPARLAALPQAVADAKPVGPSPAPHVKVQHLRPPLKAGAARRRTFHRAHRFARTQTVDFDQDPFGQPSFQMR